MEFEAKTEEQLIKENLFEPGEYDFEIIKGEDTISKKENELIAITLKVFDNEGSYRLVNDYLLESLGFKLRHICEATDLMLHYDNGKLQASDLIGKTGRLKLAVDNKNPDYPAKNIVKDYIKPDAPVDAHNQAKQNGYVNDELDDEVPFTK